MRSGGLYRDFFLLQALLRLPYMICSAPIRKDEKIMLFNIFIWTAYIVLFVWLARKGRGHDALTSGKVGFGFQAFA